MHKFVSILSGAALFVLAAGAQATPVVYGQSGTQNTQQYTFTAASTGDLMAYFVGSTAAYTNEITLLINGVATGIVGLNNHTSTYGSSLDFGIVQAGDSLVFELITLNPATGVGPWYSQTSLNNDGVNHIYSAAYAGDKTIAKGTYVAFEDLPKGGDFNYNDESFVFTNVAINTPSSNVPEPGTLALLGLGVAGFATTRRLRKKSA